MFLSLSPNISPGSAGAARFVTYPQISVYAFLGGRDPDKLPHPRHPDLAREFVLLRAG